MSITIKELIKELEQCNPDAIVYVYADHGQMELQTSGICSATNDLELEYNGEECEWEMLKDVELNKCTAVCL